MNESSSSSESVSTVLDAELTGVDFFADPYPTYQRIRDVGPAYWSEAWGVWLLCGFDEVTAAFRDWEHYSNEGRLITLLDHLSPDERLEVEPLGRHLALTGLIHSDPPVHTRIRGLLARSFTNRVVEELRPSVQTMVDQMIDAVIDTGRMDVVRDLALPLPATIIAEMLGVPVADRHLFITWSEEVLSFQGTGKPPFDLVKRGQHGFLGLANYVRELIAERRQHPSPTGERSDLLTMLMQAEDENRLSDDELVSTCITMLIGGFETTTSLITNTLHLLLTHPDDLDAIISDPSLTPGAIEESLRCETPIQIVPRRVSRPVELGGNTLEPGQLVFQMMGAANRDPRHFDDPERFDIRRANRHLAFGVGIHFCIGAPLARMEAPIAIDTMFRRLTKLECIDDAVRWNTSKPTARGAISYNVAFVS